MFNCISACLVAGSTSNLLAIQLAPKGTPYPLLPAPNLPFVPSLLSAHLRDGSPPILTNAETLGSVWKCPSSPPFTSPILVPKFCQFLLLHINGTCPIFLICTVCTVTEAPHLPFPFHCEPHLYFLPHSACPLSSAIESKHSLQTNQQKAVLISHFPPSTAMYSTAFS